MRIWLRERRSVLLIGAVVLATLVLFAWVALRSGPLAPVSVTTANVELRALQPSRFGIGLVEARYAHRIGALAPGRLARIEVQPGDRVEAGQVLGEIDPIDLDDRVQAQTAAAARAAATARAAAAQVGEAAARRELARQQVQRYEELRARRLVSAEVADTRGGELAATTAGWSAAVAAAEAAAREQERLTAELAALRAMRGTLRLVAPVAGLVTRREADIGNTVVAGQTVVEIVEPDQVWVHARFDQQRAAGLRAGLDAEVVLRSLGARPIAAQVVRIEPVADAVTEEVLVKLAFKTTPQPLPPLGELAEVTVALAPTAVGPVVANASLQRIDGRLGVWVVENGRLRHQAVTLGDSDLEGRVQVRSGLRGGETVVVHSQRALGAGSRIRIVDRLVASAP